LQLYIYINIGMNGRLSDGGIFWESDLSKALERNWLNIPEDKALPGRIMPVPHVIVADAAFTLSNVILKPYPFRGLTHQQKIFNYRLSRARQKAKVVAQACCALHNYLQHKNRDYFKNVEETVDRRYRFVYGLSRQHGDKPTGRALQIRQEFTDYVNGNGRVPWQDDMV
ncbi:hypothetical protein PPYR_01645, partial [Photinus pyralis]